MPSGVYKHKTGHHLSDETKKKIGISNSVSLKGKHLSKEHKRKLSETNKRLGRRPPIHFREKSSHWKGGISKLKSYKNFYSRQRKRRIRNIVGSHTFGEWETLKAQYNWTCPCCGKSEPTIKLSEDHIIPVSKGGSNNIENLQPLCHSCNSRKNVKIIKY